MTINNNNTRFEETGKEDIRTADEWVVVVMWKPQEGKLLISIGNRGVRPKSTLSKVDTVRTEDIPSG